MLKVVNLTTLSSADVYMFPSNFWAGGLSSVLYVSGSGQYGVGALNFDTQTYTTMMFYPLNFADCQRFYVANNMILDYISALHGKLCPRLS